MPLLIDEIGERNARKPIEDHVRSLIADELKNRLKGKNISVHLQESIVESALETIADSVKASTEITLQDSVTMALLEAGIV